MLAPLPEKTGAEDGHKEPTPGGRDAGGQGDRCSTWLLGFKVYSLRLKPGRTMPTPGGMGTGGETGEAHGSRVSSGGDF